MATALRCLQALCASVPSAFRFVGRLIRWSPLPSTQASPTLVTLPTDVLHLVLQLLYDPWVRDDDRQRYDHETCKGALLLPLSESCRYMREQTLPWIFREAYNWSRPGDRIWPETLWPFFRTVHLRDRSIRDPGSIVLSRAIFDALRTMPSLTNLTLRFDAPLPADLLHALSVAPGLT
ncbi:hypothetical protein C8F04DRAFT_1203190, partial [Mycena alexandri]